MKTTPIFFKLLVLYSFSIFYNCKSQDTQRYSKQYNDQVIKLQNLAKVKSKFYNQNFSDFVKEMDKSNIKVLDFGYGPKIASRPEIYVVRFWFIDHELTDVSLKNNYQLPIIMITFQEPIPGEIRALTRKYEGRLSPELREFLGNQKIEKIDFYGINGLTNKDRTSR